MHETYNEYLSLNRHIELTSSIKPIFVFTGSFAETVFSVTGHGDFSPANRGIWDLQKKQVDLWDAGHEKWQWTFEHDAAK